MEEIKLMAHHVEPFIAYRKANLSRKFNLKRWLFDKVYGKGDFEKVVNWAQSFDPKNTVVEIVGDINPFTGGMNIDSLCEAYCPYISTCKKSSLDTLFKIYHEKKIYSPIVFVIGLINGFRTDKFLRSAGLEIDKKYSLEHIINKIEQKY